MLISAWRQLAEQSETSFSRASGSQRKVVSPSLHHEKTKAEDLLAGHVRATNVSCQNYDFVLVTSDAAGCDFTSHKLDYSICRIIVLRCVYRKI